MVTEEARLSSEETQDEERVGASVGDATTPSDKPGHDDALRNADTVSKPPWVDRFIWQSAWKVVVVLLTTAGFLVLAWKTQTLLRLVAVSLFFALAMLPAIRYFTNRFHWRRGAAVGAIYAGLIIFVALMILVLIPGLVEFADRLGSEGPGWIDSLNKWAQDTFGVTVFGGSSGTDIASDAGAALGEWSDNIVSIAEYGVTLAFQLATIALFTFYLAADAPRIERALLARMPARRQRIAAWVWDNAVEQTGGYFYSRLLLMVINGALFFVVMVAVGMPVIYALPLSVFEGFVAEFIPAVGTYIGAAVPILVTLGVQGLGQAIVLLVWTIIYQQIENYYLSPRLSAKTMSINGGVAFGAALAGGAIAGPMGAFMALPFAALLTSIITNSGRKYPVEYSSEYDTDSPEPSPYRHEAVEGADDVSD